MFFKIFSLSILNILPFVVIALIVLVGIVFRKQLKLLSTLIALILIVGIGSFLFFNAQTKDKSKPITSASMFKKMEYIEHLKLVSFYSEEIVVLGTKEKVQKIVDKLESQIKALNQQEKQDALSIDFWQHSLDSVTEKLVTDEGKFRQEKENLKNLRQNYRSFKRSKPTTEEGSNILEDLLSKDKDLKQDSSLINLLQDYKKSIILWNTKDSVFQTKPWSKKQNPDLNRKRRAEKRKTLKDEKDKLELALTNQQERLASRLKRDLDIREEKIDDLEKVVSDETSNLKKSKKNYAQKRNESRDKWERTIKKRKKFEAKLVEAKLELKFAEEVGEEIDPEVLIILPAAVSVFIDMRKVHIEGGEIGDSLITIQIPKPEFDPVLIELPEDSAVYKLDKKDSEWVTSHQGAYYDLFGQLKEAIIEKEKEVKAKAIENGIEEEGKKMAEIYLKSFVAPLGYEVEFKAKEEDEKIPPILSASETPPPSSN